MGYTTLPADEMVAFGMSAIGDLGGAFLHNAKTTAEYEERVRAGQLAVTRGLQRSDEDNLRRAAILGMVGAGGIGYVFSEQMQAYEWNNAGTVVLGIALMVIVGEFISNRIRTRLIGGSDADRTGIE